jgi:hypothetical protein
LRIVLINPVQPSPPIPPDAKNFSRGAPPRLSYSPGEALANTGTRLMIDHVKMFAIRLENGDTRIVSGDASEKALRNALLHREFLTSCN